MFASKIKNIFSLFTMDLNIVIELWKVFFVQPTRLRPTSLITDKFDGFSGGTVVMSLDFQTESSRALWCACNRLPFKSRGVQRLNIIDYLLFTSFGVPSTNSFSRSVSTCVYPKMAKCLLTSSGSTSIVLFNLDDCRIILLRKCVCVFVFVFASKCDWKQYWTVVKVSAQMFVKNMC